MHFKDAKYFMITTESWTLMWELCCGDGGEISKQCCAKGRSCSGASEGKGWAVNPPEEEEVQTSTDDSYSGSSGDGEEGSDGSGEEEDGSE